MYHAHDHLEDDNDEERETHLTAEVGRHPVAATTTSTEDDDHIRIRARARGQDLTTGSDAVVDEVTVGGDPNHIRQMTIETEERTLFGVDHSMTVAG